MLAPLKHIIQLVITSVSAAFWEMGTNCTKQMEWNKSNWPFLILLTSQDAPPVSQPLIVAVSSVLLAFYQKMTACLPAHCVKTKTKSDNHSMKYSMKRNQFMEQETIKKALMTPPLTFSLVCDENRLFGEKHIAGWRDFHTLTDDIAPCCFL